MEASMCEEHKPTILICDDERDLCEVLALHLLAKGYQTLSAWDGEEALRVIADEKVDLVLTDIRMPLLNGLELVDRLKSNNVHVPVVILISAYADVPVEQALSSGAEALFTKPFRLSDLVQSTERFLQPPLDRWRATPAPRPAVMLEERVALGSQGDALCRGGLGRGGMCLFGADVQLGLKQRVGFAFDIDGGPFGNLAGAGIVRWARYPEQSNAPPAYGIEFTYLTEPSRRAFVEWMQAESPRAYIPNCQYG